VNFQSENFYRFLPPGDDANVCLSCLNVATSSNLVRNRGKIKFTYESRVAFSQFFGFSVCGTKTSKVFET
jgi:hypothetical protein